MPEKQKQSETCIVIYDISHGNVATRFRSSGTFAYDFITNLLLSLLWRNFFTSISCRRRTRFVTMSSWLMDMRTVGHSVGFRCGHCKYLFVSEQI